MSDDDETRPAEAEGSEDSGGPEPDEEQPRPKAERPVDVNGTQDTPGKDDTPTGSEVPDLCHTLLHSDIARDDKPGRRWAYPLWGLMVASVFVLFHATILLVHNLPSGGLVKGLHAWFNKHADMGTYMHATGNTQSWAMFAPNPHRSNIFMKVLVLDTDGEVWDLQHDIYGKRSYPYLWYDRRGKINRRLIDQKGYRRHYAAWVCREWEREHGTLPDEVQFVKMWTRLPTPAELLRMTKGRPWLGFDPMALPLSEREEEEVRCRSTRHAQLPNYLRERYGMEPMPEGHFRGEHTRTWVDAKEDAEDEEDGGAEREERRQKLKERRAKKQ